MDQDATHNTTPLAEAQPDQATLSVAPSPPGPPAEQTYRHIKDFQADLAAEGLDIDFDTLLLFHVQHANRALVVNEVIAHVTAVRKEEERAPTE